MRFTSKIELWLPGETVMRAPTFWEGLLSIFGTKPDLRASEVVTTRTVLSIAEGMSGALWQAGITNAVALVIDRRVLFQDAAGQTEDIPFLVATARQFAPQFTQGFRDLHAVYEGRDAGLHTVIEARFKARFRPEEPCAVISFGARIDALRPLPGEARETSRARVHDTLRNTDVIESYRQSFVALTQRVGASVQQGFPDGRLAGTEPVAQVVKASRKTLTTTVNVPRPQRAMRLRSAPLRGHAHGHYHDPTDDWYDDPGYVEVEVDALEAFAFAATQGRPHGHGIHVVHENGSPICEADAMLGAGPALVGIDLVSSVLDCPPGTNVDYALGGYGSDDPKPTEWSSSGDGSSGASGSSDCGSSDCSWSKDCAGSDGASSDCMSKDCSSDCASSDCSKDCSSDCASSDCASSDCASSDCASSDCASSDCASSDCSS